MTIPRGWPAEPALVAVAGDWHGDTLHAARVVRGAARAGASVVVQCGDFGLWGAPSGGPFLDTLQDVCAGAGVRVLFVDGNHEDHVLIAALNRDDRPPVPFPIRPNVIYLPRGFRWEWAGRVWAAVGGAVSVDRVLRREGVDWFPAEELTPEQATRIAAAGPVDVLVTHDCPAGVPVVFPPWPAAWDRRDEVRSGRHRARLQAVVDALQPGLIVHGHLHMAFARTVRMGWGDVVVVCLDKNRSRGPTWVLVDPGDLEWRLPDSWDGS